MKRLSLIVCALAAFTFVLSSCCNQKPAEGNKPESQFATFHDNPNEKVLIAYVYHPNELPDPTYLTCINYAFGHVNSTFNGVDIELPEWLVKIVDLKKDYPHLKVVLSIGGAGSGNFSEMVTDPELRMQFAKDCKRVVDEYKLDGIDIDWEYPGSDVMGISAAPTDVANYTLMMRDIRSCIGWDKILSQATDGGGRHIDYASVDQYMTYTQVMSYDLGTAPYHRSPLYHSDLLSDPDPEQMSADECMKAHLAAGIAPEKLVMGLAFGSGRGTDPTKCHLLEGYTPHWDSDAQVPYLTDDATGKVAWGWENEKSLYIKAKYALSNNFLGCMYWAYGGDSANGDLRRTVYLALNDPDFVLGTRDNKKWENKRAR